MTAGGECWRLPVGESIEEALRNAYAPIAGDRIRRHAIPERHRMEGRG